MKVYTIGHSNRSMEDFLKLLKKHNIECIIDVRRFPTSKFEDYKKERLEKTLYEHGIKYFHFAALGGFRGGYEKWMLSNEWKDAYEKLKKIAMKCKLAILCAEKLPFLQVSSPLYCKGTGKRWMGCCAYNKWNMERKKLKISLILNMLLH